MKSAAVFKAMAAGMSQHGKKIVEAVQAVYLFELSEKKGAKPVYFTVDLKNGDGKVTEGKVDGVKPDSTFVMLDGNGETINLEGRSAVGEDPEGFDFPWRPKAVASLSSPDGINDDASLCLFADGCSSAEQEKLSKALTPIAEESKAAGKGKNRVARARGGKAAAGTVRMLNR